MINRTCHQIGEHAAQMLFNARARALRRPSEIHIDEQKLALAMAACAQAGFDMGVKASERSHAMIGELDGADGQ